MRVAAGYEVELAGFRCRNGSTWVRIVAWNQIEPRSEEKTVRPLGL
jgi:hypothetical protein